MIEVKHLTKKYGDHIAVDDLSFTIPNGGVYGFLGPNGAGKSTTMNIMTGCLAATTGDVLIDGYDIFEEPALAKRSIGYLPEQPPLYMDMTPTEYLTFAAEAKGVRRGKVAAQVSDAMERTGLTEMKDRLIRNLSKGYKQRVGIAQAILGEPSLIILDEPTVGLDPVQILEIRELIRQLGQDHTVLLSSHILQEVSAICDHILIIAHGKLIASQKTEELIDTLRGTNTLELTVRGDQAALRTALEPLEGVDRLTTSAGDDGLVQASVEYALAADLREDIFHALVDAGFVILGMTLTTASLEDVFIELTAGEPEADGAPETAAETGAPEEPPAGEESKSDGEVTGR